MMYLNARITARLKNKKEGMGQHEAKHDLTGAYRHVQRHTLAVCRIDRRRADDGPPRYWLAKRTILERFPDGTCHDRAPDVQGVERWLAEVCSTTGTVLRRTHPCVFVFRLEDRWYTVEEEESDEQGKLCGHTKKIALPATAPLPPPTTPGIRTWTPPRARCRSC